MKTRSIKHLLTRSVPTLALSLGFLATVQSGWAQLPTTLQVASDQPAGFSLAQIVGKPIHATNMHVSLITDFLIDSQTGEVRFVVAPSGAGPAGETFRLVPMAALDARNGDVVTRLKIHSSQWDKVGTLTAAELPFRVSLKPDHYQRLTRQFSLPADAGSTANLVRASGLTGMQVQSSDEPAGTVEEVSIDLQSKTAAVLLKPADSFARADQKFVVPFTRLQIPNERRGTIATTLGRAEFPQFQRALAPTGYTNPRFNESNQPVTAAITSVQQALDRDGSLPRGSVQVMPETRIVLRGTVPNEQKKYEIQRAASQAAPGMRIDNEIIVRP